MPKLGARYVRKRFVEDGPIVTAAGVSAGIDWSRVDMNEQVPDITVQIDHDLAGAPELVARLIG